VYQEEFHHALKRQRRYYLEHPSMNEGDYLEEAGGQTKKGSTVFAAKIGRRAQSQHSQAKTPRRHV